jgi:hypothetical protein
MSTKKINKNNPQKWMEAGLASAGKSKGAFVLTLGHMLRAGYFFMRARKSLDPETQIGDYFDRFKSQISRASIYNYIALTERVFADVEAKYPKLAGQPENLLKAAEKMRLESPKEFTSICRSENLMRKFGEYDEIAQATKKLKGPEQMEFGFDIISESSKIIRSFDLDTFFATMPDGTDQTLAVQELIGSLCAAKARLDGWLQQQAEDGQEAAVDDQTAPLPLVAQAPPPVASGDWPEASRRASIGRQARAEWTAQKAAGKKAILDITAEAKEAR